MCDKKTNKTEEQPTKPKAESQQIVFIEDRGGESRRNYAKQGENYGYHQSV